MRLLKFKVTNFRSVEDSGWISADLVTAFIGINESGKSNLLIPLWKMNPAEGGEIKPVQDFPRSQYNEIRKMEKKPTFIQAHFELSNDLANQIAKLTNTKAEQVKVASVSRRLDGQYLVGFPLVNRPDGISSAEVQENLSKAKMEAEGLSPAIKAEEQLKKNILAALDKAINIAKSSTWMGDDEFDEINEVLSEVNLEGAGARSTLKPRFEKTKDDIQEFVAKLNEPSPSENKEARELVRTNLPKFVYYSNYGNLDSEIYLPTVIQNMQREDLGSREEAKARTLKVLFDFVKLSPQEIQDLGKEQTGNEEQLAATSERKTERDVLLQSAGTQLTKEFIEWWKQGNYRFRFAADGNFFRIWVSDEKRPEDIELENRSTGLQWFLSFFLVFLVEAKDAHANAILLLDEPGLTLHPLAQKDLSKFFENLAETNQLLYSTHSPFLVESDKLDRVKAVYMDDNGRTVATANLRAAAPKSVQEKSIYAVHAALGLTVSDVILQGCQPVIVEGQSDQYYFSTIKTYLLSKNLISPARELLFIPAGGAKGIKAVAPIVSTKSEELPFVIADSDKPGKDLANTLCSGIYQSQKDRVVKIGELIDLDGAEVEDLFESRFVADMFSRIYRAGEHDFIDTFQEGKPIVPQMEEFASNNNLELPDGWKVDLAKAVKKRVVSNASLLKPSDRLEKIWVKLFSLFGE